MTAVKPETNGRDQAPTGRGREETPLLSSGTVGVLLDLAAGSQDAGALARLPSGASLH